MKKLILSIIAAETLSLTAHSTAEAMQLADTPAASESQTIEDRVSIAIDNNDITEIAALIDQGAELNDKTVFSALKNFASLKKEGMQGEMSLTMDTINFLFQNNVQAGQLSLIYIIVNNLVEILPSILKNIHDNGRDEILNEHIDFITDSDLSSIIEDKLYMEWYPIQAAVEEGSIEMTDMLISRGAVITRDCLLYSVRYDIPMARFLLNSMDEESINNIVIHCDDYTELPIQLAAEGGMDSLNFMLDFYRELFPNITVRDIVTYIPENGSSLLIYSTQGVQNEVTRFLLQNGAQEVIDLPNRQGITPTDNAIECRDINLLMLLLEYGAAVTNDVRAYLGIPEEEEEFEEEEEEEYSLKSPRKNNYKRYEDAGLHPLFFIPFPIFE